jgi:hypothetical protein
VHDLPRIFVGTLACGESEFDSCCAAIAAQTGVSVTHHLIVNQPEFEAHNMLWAAWNDNKTTHDLFVKIDADTVLNRNTALREIADLFKDTKVTGAQIPIHDYFTDDLINGLNAFSPRVIFKNAKRKLFADHADTGHEIVLKREAVAHLAPIAWHGQNPSPRQSFHFGFHRKLKGQTDVLRKTANAWLKYGDASREWALAGAASARWWMIGNTHYNSDTFQKNFAKIQDNVMRHDVVRKFIEKL